KGIMVYKFEPSYVASIKWVVELPFNAHLLSSTRFVPASLVFFSPSAGEAVAWPAEGTFMLVAPDALSTMVENLFKDDRLEIVDVNDSSFVGISMRSPGNLISMSLICCFSSLISLDNLVIFEGSSFSSVGKQLAKSCEAKSLDSLALPYETEVSEPEPLNLEFELILEMEEESGVKKADLVSFMIFDKSSSFTFREMSSALYSSFAHEVVWAAFNPSLAYLVLSTRTLRLDPASV
ncbi:hypothetical protein Tco_0730944, partial [Tanacetum coccineum]